jgi:hypothetical protein
MDKKKQDYVSKKVQPRVFKKVNWNKVDIVAYKEFLNDNILPFNPEHESNFEVIEAVNHLCRTLHNAVQQSLEKVQTAKKSKAGIKRLTPEIKSCIQKSKSAHW